MLVGYWFFVLFFVRITVLPKKEIFHGNTTIFISFFKENYRKLKKKTYLLHFDRKREKDSLIKPIQLYSKGDGSSDGH